MTRRQTKTGIAALALTSLVMTPAQAGNTFEKVGTALQVALPVAAAICAAEHHDFGPYMERFAGQVAVTQALKYGLGDSPLNRRPDGTTHGFPSGHVAASFYGASYLSHNCLPTRGEKALAYGLAAAVGASRIDSKRHNVGQVLAGALVGYVFDTVSVSFTNNRIDLGWRYQF